MNEIRDELTGVVELFGALARPELEQALVELAFKQGREVDEDAFDAAIEAALDEYGLVEAEHDGESVLLAGPAAFPSLPENATDLPHIMDVEKRELDRADVGATVRDQLLDDADEAVANGDEERAALLLDVSYDLEAWAPVEADEVRDRLDALLAAE